MKRNARYMVAVVLTSLMLSACMQSEAAKAVDQQISAIGKVSLDSGDAIKTAEDAVKNLSDEDREQLKHAGKLDEARKTYDEMVNQSEADKIDQLIDGIGEVTADKATQINEAAFIYDQSSAEVKALVKGGDTLKAAQEELAKQRVGETIKLIDAIGDVTADSSDKIDAAQKSYEALTSAEKEQITNYKTLEEAGYKLKALDTIQLIDAIGEVTLDSGANISAARTSYDALTEDERGQVSNYAALEAAEENLKAQKKAQGDAALARMQKEEDAFQGATFYYPSTWKLNSDNTWTLNECALNPYIVQTSGNTYINMLYYYEGDDWVFWKQAIILVDGTQYTKTFRYFDIVHDNSGGWVWEYMDDAALSASDIDMLRAIANSGETKIRFQGDDYAKDFTLKDKYKQAIRDVLAAYDALK